MLSTNSNHPREQVEKRHTFWGRLWYVLFPPALDSSDLSRYEKEIERKVIARFLRDDIHPQQGKHLTQEYIDEGLRRCGEYARKYGD